MKFLLFTKNMFLKLQYLESKYMYYKLILAIRIELQRLKSGPQLFLKKLM